MNTDSKLTFHVNTQSRLFSPLVTAEDNNNTAAIGHKQLNMIIANVQG